jgi:hypothetical protein
VYNYFLQEIIIKKRKYSNLANKPATLQTDVTIHGAMETTQTFGMKKP